MNKDEFIRYVSSELEHGRDIDLEYQINGIPYKIKFLAADMNKGINIPCIFAIPLSENTNGQLVVEANNLESGNLQEIIEQSISKYIVDNLFASKYMLDEQIKRTIWDMKNGGQI